MWLVLFSVNGSLKYRIKILFSVNSFTENSDKYSIFSEAFTEMLGSRLFLVKGSLKQCIRKSNFSEQFVNYIKLNTVFQWSTAFVFAVNE